MVVDSIEYYEKGNLLSIDLATFPCSVDREFAKKTAQKHITDFIQPWSGFGKVNVIQRR